MTEPDEILWIAPSDVVPLTGDETFGDSGLNVRDFWTWGYSDLRSNVDRGVLAEYLVARAVGEARPTRQNWDTYDVTAPDETKIEVKSSAYLQSWEQKKLSDIKFGDLKSKAIDPETRESDEKASYQADVYVFAVHTCQKPDEYDMLDLSFWEFYVLPQEALVEAGSWNSISLSRLVNLDYEPVSYKELKAAISSAASSRL